MPAATTSATATASGRHGAAVGWLLGGAVSCEHGELLADVRGLAIGTADGFPVPHELLEMRLALHAHVLVDRHRLGSLGAHPDTLRTNDKAGPGGAAGFAFRRSVALALDFHDSRICIGSTSCPFLPHSPSLDRAKEAWRDMAEPPGNVPPSLLATLFMPGIRYGTGAEHVAKDPNRRLRPSGLRCRGTAARAWLRAARGRGRARPALRAGSHDLGGRRERLRPVRGSHTRVARLRSPRSIRTSAVSACTRCKASRAREGPSSSTARMQA